MVRNDAMVKKQLETLRKAQLEQINNSKELDRKKTEEIKVRVGDLALVLCKLHNMLSGISEKRLLGILIGDSADEVLNERVAEIKLDLIKILGDKTRDGSKLDPFVSPVIWQVDDIVKLLGGKK